MAVHAMRLSVEPVERRRRLCIERLPKLLRVLLEVLRPALPSPARLGPTHPRPAPRRKESAAVVPASNTCIGVAAGGCHPNATGRGRAIGGS